MTTAVIYTRVSTEEQAATGGGLETQLQNCQDYAASRNYEVVKVFSDEGVSGTILPQDRPAMQALMSHVEGNGVGAVIAADMKRFGRTPDVWGAAWVWAAQREIKLDTIVEGDNQVTQLFTGSAGTVDWMALRKQMNDGKLLSVSQGSVQVGGRPPYGYDKVGKVVEVPDIRGRVKEKTQYSLRKNPVEARQVRRMFKLYLKPNGSLNQVANDLRRRNVTTKVENLAKLYPKKNYRLPKDPDQRWQVTVVRNILTNPVYYGKFAYRKTKWVAGNLEDRDEDEWLWIDVPSIIDQATFDMAQQKIAERGNYNRGRRPEHDYLLRGRVRCGSCGYAIMGRQPRTSHRYNSHYYICSKRNVGAKICKLPEFHGAKVDAAVTKEVLRLLAQPDHVEAYIAARVAESEQDTAKEELDAVTKQLGELETRAGRLIDLYTDNAIDRTTFDTRKAKAEASERKLRARQAELMPVASAEVNPTKLRATWARTVRRLHKVADPELLAEAWAAMEAEPDPLRQDELLYTLGEDQKQLLALMPRLVDLLGVQVTLSTYRNQRQVTVRTLVGGEATSKITSGKAVDS